MLSQTDLINAELKRLKLEERIELLAGNEEGYVNVLTDEDEYRLQAGTVLSMLRSHPDLVGYDVVADDLGYLRDRARERGEVA